jgi:putative cardiolipin synthase
VSDDDLAATRASIAQELENCLPTLSTVLRDEDGWDERSAALRFPIAGGAVRVVSDRPGVSPLSQRTQVIDALHAAVDGAQRDLVVATPFFVPSEVQVDWYRRMIDRGVRIRVLTNSLASNQGTISNSGLKKQRRAMVKAGIELHELRTDAADKSEWDTPPREARYLGLHAKLCVIDRERVFLGAVNLDPRSRYINTEIGALIDNPEFAADAADGILELMTPDNAWRVELGGDGRLRWLSSTTTARRQPARGMMQRLVDAALGFLPVRKYT